MAEEPFATVEDLEEAWRPLTPAEATRADKLIQYASRILRQRISGIDERIAAGTLSALDAEMVVVAMVKRAMINTALEGVESQSQTAGPFAQTTKLSNPNGNLYLTADELSLLGAARGAMGTIRTVSGYPPMPGACRRY